MTKSERSELYDQYLHRRKSQVAGADDIAGFGGLGLAVLFITISGLWVDLEKISAWVAVPSAIAMMALSFFLSSRIANRKRAKDEASIMPMPDDIALGDGA
mgnify:FL=1